MSLAEAAGRAAERWPLPDRVTAFGISQLVGRTRRQLAAADPQEGRFVREMSERPIAEFTDAANEQHYALPPAFFAHVLGPQRKYSCCLYDGGAASLGEAEEAALTETADHARLADGQRILELGCGWGSLSMWMAQRFPAARITAMSNSAPQRAFIEALAAARGLANLQVVTEDINRFVPAAQFDRIVSVEMFEHVANWPALLERLGGWLRPDGRVFVHVFSHRSQPYRFDHADRADWIAQHFFTGGIMPSHGLMRQACAGLQVEAEWRWNGRNYARTAQDWLVNFDRNRAAIVPIMQAVYGADWRLWMRRWRLFFLATTGLFGHSGGAEWAVSHYLLRQNA